MMTRQKANPTLSKLKFLRGLTTLIAQELFRLQEGNLKGGFTLPRLAFNVQKMLEFNLYQFFSLNMLQVVELFHLKAFPNSSLR
jgi:hypothetical protein